MNVHTGMGGQFDKQSKDNELVQGDVEILKWYSDHDPTKIDNH